MVNIEEKIGYTFQNPKLLQQALTHSSFANEHGMESYERLEFLGDAILGMVVAEYLFHKHPKMPEGELTRTRSSLVCEDSLVEVSDRLGFGAAIRLGKGEIGQGARRSIRADVVEAVLAALYLDGGISPAKMLISTEILSKKSTSPRANRDSKTLLQEWVQRKPNAKISYDLLREEGPDHQKVFFVEVSVNGKISGQGKGKSKKEAEQKAAEIALNALKG